MSPAKGAFFIPAVFFRTKKMNSEKMSELTNRTRKVIVGNPSANAKKKSISPKPKLTFINSIPLKYLVYKYNIERTVITNRRLDRTNIE